MKTLLFATFLGLYLMGEEIPQELMDYVNSKVFKTENPSMYLVMSSLTNAPDLKDPVLRELVLSTLE